MDKDRLAGSAKQAAAAVKKGVGVVTGDQKLQTEAALEKTAGKAQNAFGGAKDAVREAARKQD
ncbi:MAG: CsbD family protein [Pseudomonadota bacterium]|nr:CsbD family protein [Pseudomonadota bacterium]